MTISYPLTAPSDVPASITFSPRFAVGENESAFTYSSEVYEHIGQQMIWSVQIPPLNQTQASDWEAFFLALNGVYGTFTLGDPTRTAPRGTGNGTPVVDGAGQQRSKTLTTRGWAANERVLMAGDYFQLGTRLHRSMQHVDSDGSGEAIIDLFPRVRDVLVDGTAITLNNTVGVWKLSQAPQWSVQEAQIYGFAFQCKEAI